MKHVLFCVLIIFSQQLFSQSYEQVYPQLPFTNISEVDVHKNEIVTFGSCDLGLYSNDGGQSFISFDYPSQTKSIKISPRNDENTLLILTNNNLQEYSVSDQSSNILTGSNVDLLLGTYRDLEIFNDYIFVRSNTTIAKKHINQDSIWRLVISVEYEDDYITAWDFINSSIYLGSRNGLIHHVSLNDGNITLLNEFTDRVNNISMFDDQIGYINISGENHPFKTLNQWSSFNAIESLENIQAISLNENTVISVNTNRLYVSEDGGLTSSYISLSDSSGIDLIFASCVEEGIVYFGGRSTTLIKSDDYGKSFSPLIDRKSNSFRDIDKSGNHIWAVGDKGSITYTQDQISWHTLNLDIIGKNYCNTVDVLSNQNILVSFEGGHVILDTDANVIHESSRSLNSVLKIKNSDELVAVQEFNNEVSIVKSYDNGVSWTSKAKIESGSNLYQDNTGKIYVTKFSDQVFESSDLGESWSIETYPIDKIRFIHFDDVMTGYLTTFGDLYKTTDAGETWEKLNSVYRIRNMLFIDEGHFYYTTEQNGANILYETKDGGLTQTLVDHACTLANAVHYDEVNNELWYANNGGFITKVKLTPSSTFSNLDYNLNIRLFPNPISNDELLTITNNYNHSINYKIVNYTGQVVSSGILTSPIEQLSINELSDGIYFFIVNQSRESIKFVIN